MAHLPYVLTRVGGDFGEQDYLLDLDYEVASYDPGNSYGPPENCELPSGGEIERLDITYLGEIFAVTDAERAAIEAFIYEKHEYGPTGDYYEEGW